MKLLSWIPASWWTWRVWRYLNPVHVVGGVLFTVPFTWLARQLGTSWLGGLGLAALALAVIGVAHEQGDGDFQVVNGGPREGIKDAYSFPAGVVVYMVVWWAVHVS